MSVCISGSLVAMPERPLDTRKGEAGAASLNRQTDTQSSHTLESCNGQGLWLSILIRTLTHLSQIRCAYEGHTRGRLEARVCGTFGARL